MCDIVSCEGSCNQTDIFEFQCECDEINGSCKNHTCIPVYNSEETGRCENFLQYSQTTNANESILSFENREELLENFDIDDYSEQTETCKDSVSTLMCMLLQPECHEGDIIPPCRATCTGEIIKEEHILYGTLYNICILLCILLYTDIVLLRIY